MEKASVTAYVDGSYDERAKVYSYGCVILQDGVLLKELSGTSAVYSDMRNVAGEILGAVSAVRWAIKNGYNSLKICYDYEGIKCWAKGIWKTNREGTKQYKRFMKDSVSRIDISFEKIAAHSGDFYNDRADTLAKAALGI